MAHCSRTLTAMKQCYTCKNVLSSGAFAPSVAQRRKGGLCKACRAAYGRVYYRNHKRKINEHRLLNRRRYRNRNRVRITEYLSTRSCVDCGEKDPRVLEFDHVRGKKDENISNLVREGCAWQRIVSEIAKCEVRCANCHRRKTWNSSGGGTRSGRSSAW